jgi:hypothetical protein
MGSSQRRALAITMSICAQNIRLQRARNMASSRRTDRKGKIEEEVEEYNELERP